MSCGVCPTLDSTTSLSASPQICPTADTSPAENWPWPTTIAFGFPAPSPSLSLMIFLEILSNIARRRRVLHPPNESLVECFGGVDPRIAKQVVQRDDFGDHGDVLSRVEIDSDLRQLDIEYGCPLHVEAGPFDNGVLVPFLELNHYLDALLLPD